MWMPREPLVFGQPTSPAASSASLRDQRDLPDLLPRHARHGVEVDPQLVGVVEVLRPDRVRVEVEAAEVGDPCEACRLVEHDLVRGPAAGNVSVATPASRAGCPARASGRTPRR